MERRKRKSLREWEEIICEQERSGLSARGFCQGEAIGLQSFYMWRRRIRDNASCSDVENDSREAFIDMGHVGSCEVGVTTGVSPWVVTLDLGEGFKLTLQRG